MRARSAYISSLSTTTILIASSVLMLGVLGAIVGFRHWPSSWGGPSVGSVGLTPPAGQAFAVRDVLAAPHDLLAPPTSIIAPPLPPATRVHRAAPAKSAHVFAPIAPTASLDSVAPPAAAPRHIAAPPPNPSNPHPAPLTPPGPAAPSPLGQLTDPVTRAVGPVVSPIATGVAPLAANPPDSRKSHSKDTAVLGLDGTSASQPAPAPAN